jgi:hypothetical protein
MTERIRRMIRYVASVDALVLVPVTALVLFDGNRRIATAALERFSVITALLGTTELLVGVGVLSATVPRWAKWVPGLIGLGALKGLWSVWTGTMFSFPDKSFPRVEAVLFVLYAGCAALLTWRFVNRRPEGHERIAIVVFLVSTFPVLFFKSQPGILIPSLTIGLAALLLGRSKSRGGQRSAQRSAGLD